MNRRSFLKLAGAVPFMGPLLAQLGNPSTLERLRAISLHIARAPKRLFYGDWWQMTNWSLNRLKSFCTDFRGAQ